MVFKKELSLYSRNDKEELIPQEVELEINELVPAQAELKGQTAFITPMTRGEIKEVFANTDEDERRKDVDGELILKHCKNPTFTAEEVKVLKPAYSSALINTIFRESGLDFKRNSKKKAAEAAEDDFAKNS